MLLSEDGCGDKAKDEGEVVHWKAILSAQDKARGSEHAYDQGLVVRAANTYDAWNRATSIRGVTYAYDALGRRIWESANGGRAFFYDGQRMIETRTGPINALSTSAHEQYVYGEGYIDDVILRDADVNGGGNLGINGSGLDQRIYYQQDREYNVVAITDQSGNVVERYAYDPYGSQSALDANWNLLSDGSEYGNQIGFTGRWLDDTGMWYFRARYLEPVLGRFVSRDPASDIDGEDLYCAYFVPNDTDAMGTSSGPITPIGPFSATGEIHGDSSSGDLLHNPDIAIQANFAFQNDRKKPRRCKKCKKIYWRQFTRSIAKYAHFTTYGPSGNPDWHIDVNEIYPFNTPAGGGTNDDISISMDDRPSWDNNPLLTGNLQFARQEFVSQVICLEDNGVKVALTDPIKWGHRYYVTKKGIHGTESHHVLFLEGQVNVGTYLPEDNKKPEQVATYLGTWIFP